jgi:hypothetical protein
MAAMMMMWIKDSQVRAPVSESAHDGPQAESLVAAGD